jgi:hypothetical protein
MKLNSAVVAINSNVEKRLIARSSATLRRNRLDTVCHVLLLAAGVAVNVAAATQGLLDSRGPGNDLGQIVASPGVGIRHFAERAVAFAAASARDPLLPPLIGA